MEYKLEKEMPIFTEKRNYNYAWLINQSINFMVGIGYVEKYSIEVESIVSDLQQENQKLRALLALVGSKTHKCKELHDWYCVNVDSDQDALWNG